MQTAPTTPGKTYSVHTMKGCTIIAPDGWQKTIEAPDGYFDAHFGRVVIDGDDEASIKELFKLAPQQRLTILGVLGGDQLPVGYTRVAYLEGTGTQYIRTAVVPTGNMNIKVDVMPIRWDFCNYVFGNHQIKGGNIVFSIDYNNAYDRAGLFRYGTQTRYFRYGTHKLNIRYNYEFERNVVFRNGALAKFESGNPVEPETFEGTLPILLFASVHDNTAIYANGGKRIWSFSIEKPVGYILNYIPAVNADGQPGMYDTISKVFSKNVGSGDFIIGVETQQQLDAVLRKLPDRTGQTVGTLTVRLADELQTPENLAKLDSMADKNWEISQAA